MGIFKALGFLATGGLIRPTTSRERSRLYQRRANSLLEEQLGALQSLGHQQQFAPVPTDVRLRGTCPACMELMLVGASTCPHCHTTGITWPSAPDRCPNCVSVIPFGASTCPHCHTTGLTWPSAPSQAPIPHFQPFQSSHNVRRQVDPREQQKQREREAEAGPEVTKLRKEISKVAQRRDKMRQSVGNHTCCTACNEKMPTGTTDCFNCQYKELRQRIDRLTNKW